MIQPWQRVTQQKVTQSFAHVKDITFSPLVAHKGTGGPLIIEAEISGHAVSHIHGRRLLDGVTPKDHAKKAEIRHKNFKVAIHPDFSDQEITIGGTVSIKARKELCTLLKRNLDIFAWQPSDMTGVPRLIAEQRLNIREGYSHVRQKTRAGPGARQGEHNIRYRPWTSVKGQILADFLVKKPNDASQKASVIETPQEPWTLFTNGSSCVDGSGAGLILTSPKGTEFIYALWFQFTTSNNEADVDSKLVANQVLGTYVAKEENMVKYLEKAKILTSGFANFSISQVLVEVLKEKSIQEEEVETVVEVEGPTWMTPIMEYLKDGTLLDDIKERKPGNNHQRSGEEVHVGQHSMPFRSPKRNSLGQRETFAFNRLVESANQSLGKGIKACLEAVIPSEIKKPKYPTALVDTIHNNQEIRLNLDLLEERHECAAIHKAKAKLKIAKYYNTQARDVTFRPRDFVYCINEASHAVDGGKLGPKWEGPSKVTEALRDGAYRLRSMDGAVISRTQNIANLKKCYL
nr:reverse transcriptase domain-containing protein [Tanacetum cinerariifolium]